ncbi:MAG TPA: sensor histidine kinase [Gaiellaceae bacterium]|nr:sensor histidine kinase [Gaiellaceae bacterium]
MVANALSYGAGDVVLSARTADHVVQLHVTDRGRGFDTAFLGRAFDRFSRADPARSTPGAGLGLSIVALIAEAHGGTASIANRGDGGADVWLSIPQFGS